MIRYKFAYTNETVIYREFPSEGEAFHFAMNEGDHLMWFERLSDDGSADD